MVPVDYGRGINRTLGSCFLRAPRDVQVEEGRRPARLWDESHDRVVVNAIYEYAVPPKQSTKPDWAVSRDLSRDCRKANG